MFHHVSALPEVCIKIIKAADKCNPPAPTPPIIFPWINFSAPFSRLPFKVSCERLRESKTSWDGFICLCRQNLSLSDWAVQSNKMDTQYSPFIYSFFHSLQTPSSSSPPSSPTTPHPTPMSSPSHPLCSYPPTCFHGCSDSVLFQLRIHENIMGGINTQRNKAVRNTSVCCIINATHHTPKSPTLGTHTDTRRPRSETDALLLYPVIHP